MLYQAGCQKKDEAVPALIEEKQEEPSSVPWVDPCEVSPEPRVACDSSSVSTC